MKVELDSKVYTDLLEIMEYYDREGGAGVAADFYAQFRDYAKMAGERPYSFPSYGELRRVNLQKFPHYFSPKLSRGLPIYFVCNFDVYWYYLRHGLSRFYYR